MKRRLFIDALSFASPGVVALVCALTAACAAQRGAPLQPRDSLLTAVNNEAAPQETWLYRPLHPAALLARIAVDAERTLYVGRSGERWLSDSSQRSDTPASALAPEGLIAAAAQGDKGWAFIGESGSVYLSDAPLGPWTSVRQSTEALVQVTAAADSLVAVGRQGQLWQSPDLGLSWGKVGPAGVRFADVAMTSAGSAIALSVPEQSWLSGDYGKSWQLQPIAARGLLGVAARDGTILARGVLGRYAWRAAAQGGDFQSATNEQFAPLSLPFKKPRGPSARALQSRHALVVLGRYFELSREAVDGDKRSGWKLYSGLVAGELGETPVPSLAQCSDVALTASEDILYLACARESGRGKGNSLVNIDLLAGGASGEQWKSLGVTISGKLGQLQWVAGANGALAFSGACPASKPDCASAGIYFVERAGQSHKPTLRVSGAPSLEGSAAALIASADGRRIYALGRRTKSDVLGLFVSQNGGRTFDAREVDGLPVRAISASSLGMEQAGVAADGTITVSFAALTGTRARLAVFDEQGRLMALSPPPADRATLGAYGTHAIAVDPKGAFWWESLDGGASWRDRGHLPATVCTPTSTTSSDCLVKVACFESGCVFGDSLTRLGWTSAQPELASARRTAAAEEPTQESFATPLACSVDSKAWQRLPLVEKVPTADQAALGGFAWFAMGENPVDSEVVLWRAKGNAETVERRELLKPANDPVKFAYFRSLQVEGAAAIRFQVPAKIGQEMGPLEVAWEDLIHGASVHQVLSVAGGYQAADSEGEGNVAQRAKPALLSITEGGLYLRAHGETNKEQETFFLDGRTATSLPRVIWPADLQPEHDDWLRVGQQNFPVLFLGSTALVRANRSGPNWAFSAQSIGWLEPERFGLRQAMDLTYVQGHPALHVEWFDTSTHESWASLMPFSQSAPLFAAALSAPTQTDLSPVPAPCSAADLQSTARIVAAPQWGTRHPIQVIEGSALHVLLTQNAVIHGSKEKPCVAAFDAITTGQDSASVDGAVQAIVSPGDLQHAWLFRRMLDAPLARPYVEYRTMSCRFDASLNVPLTPSEPSN